MSIGDALSFFRSLRLDPSLEQIAAPLIAEIVGRLQYLIEVGLDYLSLGRGSDTLSGGELQRARLAAQLGSGLVGVCTILDEPTAGLHPRDTARLIASLRRLLVQGNSVLVVEHDASMIQAADWVLDLGPGAGPDGGFVVAAGPPEQLTRQTARSRPNSWAECLSARGGTEQTSRREPGMDSDPGRDAPQPETRRRTNCLGDVNLRHGGQWVGQEYASS